MGFAEYFKQWTSQNFSLNENEVADTTSELVDLINLYVGGDVSNKKDIDNSSENIRKVLSKIDIEELENPKEGVQKIASAFSKASKTGFVLKFLDGNKTLLNSVLTEKKKFKIGDNFKTLIEIKSKEASLSNNIYKVYEIFNYLKSLPEKDETSQVLDAFKDAGFFIKVDPNQKGNRFKITGIGAEGGQLKSNQSQVTFNNGETKIFTKEDILKFIKNDPAASQKAEELTKSVDRKSIDRVLTTAQSIISNEILKLVEIDIDNIDAIPETEDGREYLEVNWKPLIDALGYGKIYKAPVEKKEKAIDKTARPSVKKKNRIKNRLLSALNGSLLPPMSNGVISEPGGDYFKLFKKLESQNGPWLELSIREYFKGSDRLVQFNQNARKKESSLEEDQLAYLGVCKIWIIKYIESEVDGSLIDKDTNSATAKTRNIALEKEKEIRNYYLSRDFNMSNTRGLQLKPDLTLPLYVKVKLAVSEADRIKESPLKNIIKGIGTLVVGLLAGIPDNTDVALAQKNADQNRMIFNGLLRIVTAGAYTVGKQQGRDFEQRMDKVTNKLRLDAVGLTPYRDGEGPKFFKTADGAKSNEAVVSNVTEDGIMMVNPEGTGGTPGQIFQTPDMLPSDMDPLSLAGPGKKKKNEDKSKIVVGTKVANFKDFLKGK